MIYLPQQHKEENITKYLLNVISVINFLLHNM